MPSDIATFALRIKAEPGGAIFVDGLMRIPQTMWPTVIARRVGFEVPEVWTEEKLEELYQYIRLILKKGNEDAEKSKGRIDNEGD